MFWGFGVWKGCDIYGEVYYGIPMEQIHLSLVKLVINSILDPKALDFETWVLDVLGIWILEGVRHIW